MLEESKRIKRKDPLTSTYGTSPSSVRGAAKSHLHRALPLPERAEGRGVHVAGFPARKLWVRLITPQKGKRRKVALGCQIKLCTTT